MAKRKKTIIAGPLVKTVVYTAPEPQDGPRTRAVKSHMTTAAQKAMNDKTARGRLEFLLAGNFVGSDLHVTLTYRPEDLPTERKEAVKRVRKFLATLRTQRKKQGKTLTYVYVTENKHEAGRFHHHVVLNATGRDYEAIRSLWPWGDVVDFERVDRYDYAQLALYITKESAEDRPVGAQMWTGSRNLQKPTVTVEYVSNETTITPPLGVYIIEREEKITEFGGYSYIKYRLPARVWRDGEPLEHDPRPARWTE